MKLWEIELNGFHYYLGTGTQEQATDRLLDLVTEVNKRNYDELKEMVTRIQTR